MKYELSDCYANSVGAGRSCTEACRTCGQPNTPHPPQKQSPGGPCGLGLGPQTLSAERSALYQVSHSIGLIIVSRFGARTPRFAAAVAPLKHGGSAAAGQGGAVPSFTKWKRRPPCQVRGGTVADEHKRSPGLQFPLSETPRPPKKRLSEAA